MNYNFPFEPNDKIIELGGGQNPMFHPNLDIRECPEVDIVADLNEPFPIKNEEWDGVFCSYLIEHLSWRRLGSFLSEVFRILKPGGKAVFITANTEAQMRHLIETEDWDDASSMLFGDQNYEGDQWRANAHSIFFSPYHAGKLFKKAGFERVITLPWGMKATDMVVEVSKPGHRNVFNKNYFFKGEGYEHYRDFPTNWLIFDKIMARKPESVLEIGCGKGYLVKRLQDAGIQAYGIDISQHCVMTRAANNITQWDVCQTPWNFEDKQFDMCISFDLLDRIPEGRLPLVYKEMERVSERGFHGLDFKENNPDKTRCTNKSQDWWELPDNHELISKVDLEKYEGLVWDNIPTEGDGKFKVQLGSFINMAHHDWINMDILALHDYAYQNCYKFVQIDVRSRLPFVDDSVDLMFCSHLLDQFTYDEARKLLDECKRIMKKGATFRVLVSDANVLIDCYKNKGMGVFDEISDESEKSPLQIMKLWALLFSNHRSIYDWSAIEDLGKGAGFKVELKAFREGHEQILRETTDMLADSSLCVEFVKL